jgi:membrane associated rhomboid family serine protease
MRTDFRQKRSIFMSNFGRNTLIQLIAAIGMGYILLHGVKVILIVLADHPKAIFPDEVLPAVALQTFPEFLKHPWTIFTYFWGHASFLNLVSNMLWLYCFGSVLQTLIGFKEIIPLYISSCILSAVLFLGVSYFWPGMPDTMVLTALPGVTAFATAAILLAPKFRFHLGDRFAIPLWVVLIVFFLLNVLSSFHNTAMTVLIGASVVTGGLYMQLIKSGYQPGRNIYSFFNKIEKIFTPDKAYPSKRRNETLRNLKQQHKHATPEYIDKLLDKINQKGYDSLSNEEKEALKKASEDIF